MAVARGTGLSGLSADLPQLDMEILKASVEPLVPSTASEHRIHPLVCPSTIWATLMRRG
jgi:hypothetical protein